MSHSSQALGKKVSTISCYKSTISITGLWESKAIIGLSNPGFACADRSVLGLGKCIFVHGCLLCLLWLKRIFPYMWCPWAALVFFVRHAASVFAGSPFPPSVANLCPFPIHSGGQPSISSYTKFLLYTLSVISSYFITGILTKPDLVDKGTEEAVVDIVRNLIIHLKKGYMIVKCRGQQDIQSNLDLASAIQKEKAFFEDHEHFRCFLNR